MMQEYNVQPNEWLLSTLEHIASFHKKLEKVIILTLSNRMLSDRRLKQHQSCSENCHTALKRSLENQRTLLRGHLTRFLTVKLMAECRQLGVGTTNAHFPNGVQTGGG